MQAQALAHRLHTPSHTGPSSGFKGNAAVSTTHLRTRTAAFFFARGRNERTLKTSGRWQRYGRTTLPRILAGRRPFRHHRAGGRAEAGLRPGPAVIILLR